MSKAKLLDILFQYGSYSTLSGDVRTVYDVILYRIISYHTTSDNGISYHVQHSIISYYILSYLVDRSEWWPAHSHRDHERGVNPPGVADNEAKIFHHIEYYRII